MVAYGFGIRCKLKVVAKRLRIYAEIAKDSITIPAFLDNRFEDTQAC